jgi:hypothetical protein
MKWPHRLPVLRDSVSKDALGDGLLSSCDALGQSLTTTRALNEPSVLG